MSFIITDNPIEDYGTGDSLEFKRLAKHFTNMCSSKDTRTPFAIAINGKWGSGKTSMMKIIKSMLDDERNQVKEKKRPCYTFWFNAWKYQTVDHMLVALLLVMFKELEKEATFWDQFCTQIDKLNFMAGIVDKVYSKISDAKTKNFIRQLRVMEKAAVMDDFSQMMEIMVNNYCVSGGDAAAKKIFHAELKKGLCEKAFVFFIDDLDRCQSDRIVQVFESIKLFMGEFPGCIFFLGMDNNQIKKAILNAYSQKDGAGFNAAEYLEKVVQMTVSIPSFEYKIADFIDHLFENHGIDKKHLDVKDVFINSGFKTPRAIKRLMNDYLFSISFVEANPDDILLRLYARFSVIRLTNSDFFETLQGDAFLIWAWERFCKFNPYIWKRGAADKIRAEEKEMFEPEQLLWETFQFSWADWMAFRNKAGTEALKFEDNFDYLRLIEKWDSFYSDWHKHEFFYMGFV